MSDLHSIMLNSKIPYLIIRLPWHLSSTENESLCAITNFIPQVFACIHVCYPNLDHATVLCPRWFFAVRMMYVFRLTNLCTRLGVRSVILIFGCLSKYIHSCCCATCEEIFYVIACYHYRNYRYISNESDYEVIAQSNVLVEDLSWRTRLFCTIATTILVT